MPNKRLPIPSLSVTALITAAGLAAAAMGAYVGAGAAERRIAVDCSTRQETRMSQLLFVCQMAPGWKESQR